MDVSVKCSEYWEDDFSDRSSDIGSVKTETRSTEPQLVSDHCYGRGKTFSQIYIPRIPRHLKYLCMSREGSPTELADNMLSTGRGRGRGRAQVLKERVEQFECSSMSSSQESLPVLLQAMEMVSRPGDAARSRPSVDEPRNLYDLAFLDVNNSDTEDAEDDVDFIVPLLPSQRKFNFRPCVPPSQKKIVPNLSSVDDFPSLSGETVDKCDPKEASVFSETKYDDGAMFARKPETGSVFSGTRDGAAVLPEDDFVCDQDVDLSDSSNSWTIKQSKHVSKHKSKTKKKFKNCQQTEKSKDKNNFVESSKVAIQNSLPNLRTKEWEVKGDNVIEIEGLPLTGDTSNLEELVSSFGTVLHMEHRFVDTERVIRIRYSTREACEWAVACLHDSDCIFPDSCCVLVCSLVEN